MVVASLFSWLKMVAAATITDATRSGRGVVYHVKLRWRSRTFSLEVLDKLCTRRWRKRRGGVFRALVRRRLSGCVWDLLGDVSWRAV